MFKKTGREEFEPPTNRLKVQYFTTELYTLELIFGQNIKKLFNLINYKNTKNIPLECFQIALKLTFLQRLKLAKNLTKQRDLLTGN